MTQLDALKSPGESSAWVHPSPSLHSSLTTRQPLATRLFSAPAFVYLDMTPETKQIMEHRMKGKRHLTTVWTRTAPGPTMTE
jgi:hypothetical protein